MEEEKQNQTDFITTLVALSQTMLAIVHDIVRLAALEIQLAGKSLIALVGLFLLMGFLIATVWFGLMAALAFWMASVFSSWLVGLMIVVGVNILLAASVLLLMMKCRQNLKLSATRRQLNSLIGHENI